ncbi:DNA repair protein RecO [Altererythrobacter sp. RZ02]|uniref:DNA repair protein RecO n=1 Tax=Pontixanthobacter rizhaonensis TaxID=2730337 RepID=A0A848QL05_9SPHN|nr:DNA repair protein RecO [Pontixanthobacter rizhaonensis]NMW31804.1 DNA repair protein RecO [Pontixanthobacter rizhaonensis]
MNARAQGIFLSARPHGETAVIARILTEEYGMLAGYVAGGRGRHLRPVVIPGNLVDAELRAKSDSQLPFARLELLESRGPWLSEPLPAAAINWLTSLTASVLPERQSYPELYTVLKAVLDAICGAPSARGWLGALVTYEILLLRDLGYGGGTAPQVSGFDDAMATFDRLFTPIEKHLLAGTYGDVMSARTLLRTRLAKISGTENS